MGKLHNSVVDAESLYRNMRSIAENGNEDEKKEIVRLRSRYATAMLDILQAMKSDEKLEADPQLRTDFEKRFFEMRQVLAAHQAKWRLQAIEDDPHGYMRSAAGLNKVQDDFYRWVGNTSLR